MVSISYTTSIVHYESQNAVDHIWRPKLPITYPEDMQYWTVKLHVIDRWEKSSNQNKWELTKPLPLNDDSTSIIELLGPKPDVHYIYVCVKGNNGARVDSKAEERID
ncbi:hypothetical protein EJB05_48195 [Eragrostis curvula]|uniref:Uncharacterized protein n=1 Tax=Eragrostis curvula TaxID=38414 RepID=A0A5J9T1I0_9POAL|nr:hypothetical protein EJB05_48195 [Eragrostis curvula]